MFFTMVCLLTVYLLNKEVSIPLIYNILLSDLTTWHGVAMLWRKKAEVSKIKCYFSILPFPLFYTESEIDASE